MNKSLFAILSLMVVGMLLAACGGSASTATPEIMIVTATPGPTQTPDIRYIEVPVTVTPEPTVEVSATEELATALTGDSYNTAYLMFESATMPTLDTGNWTKGLKDTSTNADILTVQLIPMVGDPGAPNSDSNLVVATYKDGNPTADPYDGDTKVRVPWVRVYKFNPNLKEPEYTLIGEWIGTNITDGNQSVKLLTVENGVNMVDFVFIFVKKDANNPPLEVYGYTTTK